MQVKIYWAFRYENETNEEIEYNEGDNIVDAIAHLAPEELGECVEAVIYRVEDSEGNTLHEL